MNINMAHLRERSTSGSWINFAVFDAKSNSGGKLENAQLLSSLRMKAQATGLKIDQSALAYRENGRINFYGSKNLVDYLSRCGLPRWTHKIEA